MTRSNVVSPLGSLRKGSEERDAVHVAIAPVIAAHKLYPGQHVGVVSDDGIRVGIRPGHEFIGIVDPFLRQEFVDADEEFWLCLYPVTVVGMRHHWLHPAFDRPSEGELEESYAWLKEFAREIGMSYGELMLIVENYLKFGDVWVEQGSDKARDHFGVNADEFWKHVGNVRGGVTAEELDQDWSSPFSCSC